LELLRAYDLNPLILMEMKHASTKLAHANAFVSPRKNKSAVGSCLAAFESMYMNVVVRDNSEYDRRH